MNGAAKITGRANDPAYIEAERQQAMAADPVRDVFVSANAGSGKTHVLVNRVSRTLLLGTDVKPEKILCLTYTKAAASEMQTRLFKTLGEWSIMPEAELRAKLIKLLGAAGGDDVDLGHARRLFAQALETPEGLKVQTIHAFCERLLSRFPIEAGILPGFQALEDGQARALQDEVWRGVLQRAASAPESELAWATAQIMGANANKIIEELRRWMGHNVYKIKAWEAAGGTKLLAQRLGVNAQMTPESLKQQAWEAISKPRLKAGIADIRVSKSSAQHKYAEALTAALETADPVLAFERYAAVILTKKEGKPRTQIGIKDSGPAAHEYFGAPKSADTPDMDALMQAVNQIKSAEVLTRTRAVYELSRHFAQDYQDRKRALRRLDFSDQIMLVRRLLTQSHVSDWVRYKLDGGVDYILVDEAQDTSPQQWDIVDVMRDMFTHDQEADPRFPRTLFAVGDEKQSIYSFQGADPELFMARSRRTDGPDEAIRMRMSFRSAPDILAFVDEIFVAQMGLQKMFNAELVVESSDLITHTAKRKIPGLIELWPLSPAPQKDLGEEPWRPVPVDTQSANSSRESLGRELAQTIRGWIDTKELVNIKNGQEEIVRPIEPRDILILVRKRTGSFFNGVIRHLKLNEIAVAGADRLVLSESVAVQDLMSLARFVCLPSDDLALAEVLRGPMFDMSEADLFTLAHYRKGRLWPALKTSKLKNAAEIRRQLEHFIALSKKHAPYEFFESVLSYAAADGTSQLKLFYQRLSLEAADPIEAFLARALAHQRRGAPSLQHFVQEFLHDDQDIKRELDGTRNEVRVMTIYGAKGLEAPIVILADTSQFPGAKDALNSGMLDLEDGTFARPGNKDATPPSLLPLREAKIEKAYQEYMRLFYVALTRAESRLLICGYFSGTPSAKNKRQAADPKSWHALAQTALMALNEGQVDGGEIKMPFSNEDFKGYAFGARPQAASASNLAQSDPQIALPDWARLAAPPRPPKAAISAFTPSTLLMGSEDSEPPNRSPFSQSPDRFMRGTIIHKLLELLPEIAPDKRRAATAQFLSGYGALSELQKADISDNVQAVLEAPEFAEIFAPGSQAEISLAGHAPGLPAHMRLNAQIDRLSVTETRVFIVDYKSNRPPPTNAADVSELYVGQMAAYRELARAAYPGREIVCGLLWTDGPDMMILPSARLDQALKTIQALEL